MGGGKYRIEQNGQFLGHHSGHDPAEAIGKAVDKYGSYYKIDTNDWFDVYKGAYHSQIYVGENNER